MSDREPSAGTPKTSFPHHNFHVEFDGGVEAGFAEISGLEALNAGGGPRGAAKSGPGKDDLAARRSLSVIGLKRGVAGEAFSRWIIGAIAGRVEHRDIRIRLLDEMMRTVMTWTLANARPIKIEGPVLNGEGNDVAIEGIELHCDGIDCSRH
jgi:phage tail-like protein